MPILTNLNHLSKSAKTLKIIVDLESYIIKQDNRTSLGSAILFSIEKKVKPDLLIAELKSHIDSGNGEHLSNVIGKGLTKRIADYKF